MSAFIPAPSWPTIIELARELWGEPNKALSARDDVRFGGKGSKSVKPSANSWFDHEGNGGGGYIALWKLARPSQPLPSANGEMPAWLNVDVAYNYQNADGSPAFQVVRTITGSPRFLQRRLDGQGKWIWSIKGIKRVLYRLPELLAASPGSIVFIAEGEKDVDRLRAHSRVATCNSGGAGKWHDEYAEHLRGQHIRVIPDNDPPGEAHALDITHKLHGVALSVRIVRLPGLPPKGDVSDWLNAGNAIEDLDRLAEEAPDYQPSSEPDEATDDAPPLWDADDPLNHETLRSDGPVTEQAIMRTFVAIYIARLRFNHDSRQWLVWDGHYWRPDRRQLAFSWALDLCRTRSLSATVQKVRFAASVEQGARAMREVATAQEDWDFDPWLLGTPGGVVDLRTGILRPGRLEDMITRVTAVTPADAPDCPRWLAFLDYAFNGNDKNVLFLQRYCGYCLTGLTREEFFVFLFGDACTGKGTATETLRGIMGAYADVVPIEVFTSQSWRPAEYYRALLPGKRLILASEPPRGSIWAEAFVNEMTGGDRLSARHPAGRPFDFTPTHKPLLHGNYMPRLHGQAGGLKRRLGILPFNHRPVTPDPTLKATLHAEWPSILRWGIEGCLAWQKHGLNPPEDVRAASAAYFGNQDTFARWAEECCIIDRSLQTPTKLLRGSFNAWARANGEQEMNTNDFSDAIDRFKGAQPPLRRVRMTGAFVVKGIGLKPESNRWNDQGEVG
jgi:putative DNA primase/helicase